MKVRMDYTLGDKPCPWQRDGYAHTATHYVVTLRYGSRRMTLDYWAGSLAGEPTAESVLECLLSDASSCYAGQTFEGWCDEYGMDSDSRKAEATFKACMAQTAKLRTLLGSDFPDLSETDTETAAKALVVA